MNNSGWQSARKRAELPLARVHDLKHTFGRRLRAAGVSFEDRQDLLGHKSGRITTHYSGAELSNLVEAAEKACQVRSRKSPAWEWNKLLDVTQAVEKIGGQEWNRTTDTRIFSPLLYRLSYLARLNCEGTGRAMTPAPRANAY